MFRDANQPFELSAHMVFGTLPSFAFFGSGARHGEPVLAIHGAHNATGGAPGAWPTGR